MIGYHQLVIQHVLGLKFTTASFQLSHFRASQTAENVVSNLTDFNGGLWTDGD